jgi:hypothetical protein
MRSVRNDGDFTARARRAVNRYLTLAAFLWLAEQVIGS